MRRLERFCSRKPTRFAFVVAIVEALGGASVRERKVRKHVPYAVGGFLSGVFYLHARRRHELFHVERDGRAKQRRRFLMPRGGMFGPDYPARFGGFSVGRAATGGMVAVRSIMGTVEEDF